MLVVLAMEETLLESTDTLTTLEFLTPVASSTLPRTWTAELANPLTFAKIAHGLLQLPTRLAKRTARLLTTRSTSCLTTTVFQELTR